MKTLCVLILASILSIAGCKNNAVTPSCPTPQYVSITLPISKWYRDTTNLQFYAYYDSEDFTQQLNQKAQQSYGSGKTIKQNTITVIKPQSSFSPTQEYPLPMIVNEGVSMSDNQNYSYTLYISGYFNLNDYSIKITMMRPMTPYSKELPTINTFIIRAEVQ